MSDQITTPAADDVKARAVEVVRTALPTLWASERVEIIDALAVAGLLADPDALARAKAEGWREGASEGLRTPRDLGWTLVNPYADRIDPTEGNAP